MNDGLKSAALGLLVIAAVTTGVAGTTAGASTPAASASPVPAPAAPTLRCDVNVPAGANLASIVNSAPASTTFCLASGTYKLTGPVSPKSSDSFVGQSSNLPVVDASGTTVGFDSHAAGNVTFEYLLIKGAGIGAGPKTCPACGRGIWGGEGLRAWDVVLENNGQAGIGGGQNTASHPWLIVNSQFIDNGSTAELGYASGGIKGSSGFTILNSSAVDNIGQGIWCDVGCIGGTWTVEGNTVTGNTSGGIRYEISNAGAVIENNLVENNNTSDQAGLGGIQIASSGNATVENNIALMNQRADIIMSKGRSPGLSDVLVHANDAGVLVGCSLSGVSCD
jgi:hypothetical protein